MLAAPCSALGVLQARIGAEFPPGGCDGERHGDHSAAFFDSCAYDAWTFSLAPLRCAVLCRDRRADSPIIAPAIRLPDGEMASFKDVMFRCMRHGRVWACSCAREPPASHGAAAGSLRRERRLAPRRNRIVFVGERIGDDTVTRLVASLLALEGMDPKKEIKLYINSSGASAYSALAIVDVMRQMTCPISTVAFGQVNSTGAWVPAQRPWLGAPGRPTSHALPRQELTSRAFAPPPQRRWSSLQAPRAGAWSCPTRV